MTTSIATDKAEVSEVSVVIVGAGPAGLTIARLLEDSGIGCLVLESESRETIEKTPRAGFIEEWAIRALDERSVTSGLQHTVATQTVTEFRIDGGVYTFDFGERSGGQRHFAYPQQLLVSDLVRGYVDDAGGDIRFSVSGVRPLDVDSDVCAVEYSDAAGRRHRVRCDYVVGCDGARGVSRETIPEDRVTVLRDSLGIDWLAVLAETPPPAEHVVFGLHPDGAAAAMHRTPAVTRFYLECPPGDTADHWPDDRIWAELRKRLYLTGEPTWTVSRILEKRVLPMHNYVVEPMSYGRLFLAGDAAHLISPVAAKGMNAALHDAFLLGDALIDHYHRGDDSGLIGYTENALRRVWQYQDFNKWLSGVIHGYSSADPYERRLAAARLRRLAGSDVAGTAAAALYTGVDADY